MQFIPDGFSPENDMCHEDPGDEPGWSESYAFWAYFEEHYLYMHFQRHPEDVQMWRGYAAVMRDDGRVFAAHSFGRQLSKSGPGYQQCHGSSEIPFETFQINVDAVANISDTPTLRTQAIQSIDTRTSPLMADLKFQSVSQTYAPMSFMPTSDDSTHSNAKWTHFTPCQVTGIIKIGDQSFNLDNVHGWRDHSTGARSFSAMGKGYMLTGIFPSGRSFMAIGVGTHNEDGSFQSVNIGGVTVDGVLKKATLIQEPEGTYSAPVPNSDFGTYVLESEHGRSEITMRTTGQGVPLALLPPNFEAIGLPDGADQDLHYYEWRLDIEWDGEKGVGGWEPCIPNPNRSINV